MVAGNAYVLDGLGDADERIYWILGIALIWIIFGLISAYMVYSKVKSNITRWSKLTVFFWLPILLIGTTGGFIYYGFSIVPEERGPYLSWMADPKTTMTVSFEAKVSADFDIEYKESSSSSFSNQKAVTRLEMREEDGYYHYTVNLTGLAAGTSYDYRIPGFAPDAKKFKTAPSIDTGTFKFLLYGDSRETNKIFGNEHIPLMQNVLNTHNIDDLSFAINNGDLTYDHDYVNGWNLHFEAIRDIANRLPYFVASGNHEWNTDEPWWSTDNQPAIDIQDFPIGNDSANDVYTLNETSFSFGFGSAFFIFLGYPHAGRNKPQYLNWLETQFKIGNGTIGDGYKFMFVFDHVPPFDRRSDGYNDYEGMITTELPMYHQSGVDAMVSGHNHVLAWQNITWDPTKSGDTSGRNITYLISGAGGASLREPKYGTWQNTYDMGFYGKTVYCEKVNHYYIVEVDGTLGTTSFTCYTLGGEIREEASFTLKAFK